MASAASVAIARIAADAGNPNLPAELQDAIRNRVAFLFVRGSDGFVLKPVVELGVAGVLVWIGWGEGGAPERHLPEVKRLARLIGARWLRFHSARKGWLRVAPKMGWKRQPDDADGLLVFQIDL
ncbi:MULTISPECIES: hypothetical protein [Aeromonas]|uniref:Uncharacterized protein n=1 Tax=Aeromonas schubertii TaxID=652 RepID=A0A0S2SFK4_9GAMM|nr:MULTISPECIES: hypothetical protein [Aeromonas]ALP40485.1 hypothetical protein WL1483_1066 [Aeromonas schubertii]MBL0563677.1 hypothetical protein [Aeromonas hydrophila]CAB5657565.1 Uncharacterised protein [Aeromonas hydrophila]